jgi:hypothetical protein
MTRDEKIRSMASDGFAQAQMRLDVGAPELEIAPAEAASRGIMRTLQVAPTSVAHNGHTCPSCGAACVLGSSICAGCGASFECIEANGLAQALARTRPGVFRRAAAAFIDRLVPLPFIAFLFPIWVCRSLSITCSATARRQGAV